VPFQATEYDDEDEDQRPTCSRHGPDNDSDADNVSPVLCDIKDGVSTLTTWPAKAKVAMRNTCRSLEKEDE